MQQIRVEHVQQHYQLRKCMHATCSAIRANAHIHLLQKDYTMSSRKIAALSLSAALSLACFNVAQAESQYGYAAASSATPAASVTASASLKLSVLVPKLILLRVGSSNTAQDTVEWSASFSIPGAAPTTATVGNNTFVDWTGAAPSVTLVRTPSTAINVYAWTNAGTSAALTCAAPTWTPATGGPANGDFTITSTGTLAHPGSNLVCGAGASTSITPNAVATGTWSFALSNTAAATWKAGAYTGTVTYTATGV